MGKSLTLKKVSRNSIFIDNIFYGREVSFMLQCEGQPLKIEVKKNKAQFSWALRLKIAHYACTLFLETLPSLSIFSKSFEGIDLLSIPETIRLFALQTSLEAIQNHFSNTLNVAISIDAIEQTTSHKIQPGIDFMLTSNANYITAGTLVVPKEILVLFAKKIKDTPTLHNFKNLEMAYHICIGSTRLSQEDYQNLCEEDVVFLDQHGLTNGKKVDIVGFNELKIQGSFTPSGIIVQQITK